MRNVRASIYSFAPSLYLTLRIIWELVLLDPHFTFTRGTR